MSKKRQNYLSWDDYFMSIAILSSKRSKDPNRQVGACIVNPDNKIVAIGYNGMPNGCDDDNLPWSKVDVEYEKRKSKREKRKIKKTEEWQNVKADIQSSSMKREISSGSDNYQSANETVFTIEPLSLYDTCSQENKQIESKMMALKWSASRDEQPQIASSSASSDQSDENSESELFSEPDEPNPLNTKYPYVCHAEMNAILNKNTADLKNCRIYATLYPCNECAKIIIQSGIRKVIFKSKTSSNVKYKTSFKASERMFEMAGVEEVEYVAENSDVVLELR